MSRRVDELVYGIFCLDDRAERLPCRPFLALPEKAVMGHYPRGTPASDYCISIASVSMESFFPSSQTRS